MVAVYPRRTTRRARRTRSWSRLPITTADHAESAAGHWRAPTPPRGGAAPSDTDIAKALDPGWFYLVVGLGAAPRITGWRIRAGVATEVELG